ncbi:hypothetical protein [Sphingobacterium anhuiense]|uniref:Uncharacterized protein n=1 Tax=Sphingobacterium anhuiense TaxID=493780 RepID=A0ABW5YQ07_9SPHI
MNFKRYLMKVIPDFEEKLKDKFDKNVLDDLLNNQLSKIKGKPFYNIMILLTSEFDLITKDTFTLIIEDAKASILDKKNKANTEEKRRNNIQKFIDQFITLQTDIADSAYISETRLSKILTSKIDDFYAWEVVSIANSQNYSRLKAFEDLYKNDSV